MSIYVGIIVNEQSRDISPDYPTLFIEDDDGYYWHLYPLFKKLHENTGQYIDLYGDATFNEATLLALQRTVSTAREQIQQEPEPSWQVYLGTRLARTPEEQDTSLYATVEKSQLLKLLNTLDGIIISAQQQQKPIRFMGD